MERSKMRRIWLAASLLLLSGCATAGGPPEAKPSEPVPAIVRYEGEPSPAFEFVYTTRRETALTFNGMADEETMMRLLDKLDEHGIRATFFLPGMRVAEEPEIAREISRRGHEVENNTLNRLDLSKYDYETVYEEIRLTNEIMTDKLGIVPKYVRTKNGEFTDDVRRAAAQLGMDGVVKYNINPQDWDGKDADAIGDIVERYIMRGAVIVLNTDLNPDIIPAVDNIAAAADDIGYKLVPFGEMAERGDVRKPLEEIPGYDAASLHPEYEGTPYELFERVETDRKQVALTFDDWGSDRTITRLLDILKTYGVHATFFLRANGVENNPNLARAIVEDGHEAANHTYSHPVVTTISPAEIQEEVVKAHRVITEAIQQQPSMLFRPPTGEIDDEAAQAVAAAGYPLIAQYDVTTLDWDPEVSAQMIEDKVLSQTKPGSVILLHMLDDIHTLDALPRVLEQLREQGYEITTLSELLKLREP